jgi:hypothetical protein
MTSDGRVTLSSPDHVSLLVHRTFNVSIPRHHIPTDQWEFEYGPAENDPEFGGVDDEMDVDITTDVHGDDVQAADQRGRWVHKVTGDRLGGKDRWLQFTVVGYAFPSFSKKRAFSITWTGLQSQIRCSPWSVPYSLTPSLRSTFRKPNKVECEALSHFHTQFPMLSNRERAMTREWMRLLGQVSQTTTPRREDRRKQRGRQRSERRRSGNAIKTTPHRPSQTLSWSPNENEKRPRSGYSVVCGLQHGPSPAHLLQSKSNNVHMLLCSTLG